MIEIFLVSVIIKNGFDRSLQVKYKCENSKNLSCGLVY